MTNEQIKLKASLVDAIEKWFEEQGERMACLDTYFGDNISLHMGEAAFNVLLAQTDLTAYLRSQGGLNEKL